MLTRLRKPSPKNYQGALAGIVARLSPLEKAKLYDRGEPPSQLKEDEKKLLVSATLQLRREYDEEEGEFEGIFGSEYEGRRGASAREMMAMLSRAAENRNFRCLTPMAVFEAITELCRDMSLYEFLRFPVDEGYHDVQKFLEDVKEEYIELVSQEVFDSISLIDEGEYNRLFLEYFRHVKAFCSREKVYNPTTNSYEPANLEFLESIERLRGLSEPAEVFRSNIMTRIGAKSLERPGHEINYAGAVPGHLPGAAGELLPRAQPHADPHRAGHAEVRQRGFRLAERRRPDAGQGGAGADGVDATCTARAAPRTSSPTC